MQKWSSLNPWLTRIRPQSQIPKMISWKPVETQRVVRTHDYWEADEPQSERAVMARTRGAPRISTKLVGKYNRRDLHPLFETNRDSWVGQELALASSSPIVTKNRLLLAETKILMHVVFVSNNVFWVWIISLHAFPLRPYLWLCG